MTLQSEIFRNMEKISSEDKEEIKNYLMKFYAQFPCKQVNIEIRSVKNIKCVNAPSWGVIATPAKKIESVREWLESEGFTILKGETPNGSFWGYKMFLYKNYASL